MTSTPEEPRNTPDGLIARPRSQWRVLKDIFSPKWIKRAAQESWAFAPCCVGPAILFAAGNLVENLGFKAAVAITGNQQQVDIGNLLIAIVILFVTLIATLVLLIWALVGWLARFTAFSRFFLGRTTAADFQRGTVKEDRQKALDETKQHKRALTKFWLFVTLFLLVPLGAIMILTTGIGLCSPPIAGPMAIPVPLPVVQGMVILLIIFVFLIFAYSLVAVAASARCEDSPKKSAIDAFRWTFTLSPAVIILTILMFAIAGIISSPDELMSPTNLQQYFSGTRNTWVLVASTIWGGVTSVFLWPFCLTPFCELLKDRIAGRSDH